MNKVEWTNETGVYDFSGNEGFTYKIDFTDGTYYFGKKTFIKRLRYPPLKGKKRVRLVKRESDWRKYEGSCERRYGRVVQKKTILKIHNTKGQMNFGEIELLVKERVLHKADCLNFVIPKQWYAGNVGARKIKWVT